MTLLLLSIAAVAVHGYHPYAEDAEIYLPGVEKALHPELFPVGTAFFESHASLSLFSNLIAYSVRVTRLPFPYAPFAWHLASIFLFLLAAWQLSGRCFESLRARAGAVALISALLTMPVAGTALYIMDQYVNARNLAAFSAVFAVVRTLERKYARAAVWLVFTAAIHPLMAAFAISFCLLLPIVEKIAIPMRVFALLPFSGFFNPPSPAYHEAARLHGFHYILQWQWYEWLGIVAPIPLFWWFRRIAQSRHLPDMVRMCRALVMYDLAYFVAALVVSVPKRFEALARIQPLRSLHLLYILLLMFAGGLIAEHILKKSALRWIIFFAPLVTGMFLAQRVLFPASDHIEWPWAAPRNEWAQAFLWIQQNTPTDSILAIDPEYMKIPGEDMVGFRALTQRSRLADIVKDSGPVSMFPPLAEQWYEQLQAQRNWKHFEKADFLRLRHDYGVNWVVLQVPGVTDLSCPYQNPTVRVCQIGN